MENQLKLANSKEVIAYLANKFPACFILNGEAKPLKIGIFKDIAESLAEDPLVSKTQLRTALRLYTSSWRYLYSIKVGAQRVDLDGQACGEIDETHVQFAKQQLAESKAKSTHRAKTKVQETKKSEDGTLNDSKKGPSNIKRNDSEKSNKSFKGPQKNQTKSTSTPSPAKQRPQTKPNKPALIDLSSLTLGQKVKVSLGRNLSDAVVQEVMKDSARVILDSGMSLVLKAEYIR